VCYKEKNLEINAKLRTKNSRQNKTEIKRIVKIETRRFFAGITEE